jgi:hypothetical protein
MHLSLFCLIISNLLLHLANYEYQNWKKLFHNECRFIFKVILIIIFSIVSSN